MTQADNKKRDGFFLAISKRQADAMASQLRCEGKLAIVAPRSSGVWVVRWTDWQQPRGRWNDSRHPLPIPR